MDALNPVTVTCCCKRCGREAATFENAWIQVGPYDFVPAKPAFYDVQSAGLQVQHQPVTRWEKSLWKDLLCMGCGLKLGILCSTALEGCELNRKDIALRIPDLHTAFRDYRTANNGPGPDPKLNIVRFLDLYSSFPPKSIGPSTESMINQPPPQYQPPAPPIVDLTTPPAGGSGVNLGNTVEELKDVVWRIENELGAQRKDIDRVSGMVGRMETDMLVFRSFMADVRFELDSKATTANFQANLQQMGDGIWREIHALRARGQDFHPAQSNSDDTIKFTIEEIDALTDSISKINQKASEVDGLRMELQFMKNRLKRMEDASRIPSSTSSNRRQSDAPPTVYPRPEEVQQKRPAEASDNSPNKRPRHMDESTVMATYNIVHPPSGHSTNSPHGQYLQYTQQLNDGARPGHMNLCRAQPSPAPAAHTGPYVGPYHQPPSTNHQHPPSGPQYSPQRPPMQLGQGPPRPEMPSIPPKSQPPPVTSQPSYAQYTQSFPPPSSMPPQSWSPQHYIPQPQAGKLKFTDTNLDQPRRPRGRPRKDGTVPGTPRNGSSPHPSTDGSSNAYPFLNHTPSNTEPKRPSGVSPHNLDGSSFNMSSVEKPTWLRDREPAVGSFQSGVFRPTHPASAKRIPMIDDNGVRLTKKGLPDGRIQNGKPLGDWRARNSADNTKSASSTPGLDSRSPDDQASDADDMRDAESRPHQKVLLTVGDIVTRESTGHSDSPTEREESVEMIIKCEPPH